MARKPVGGHIEPYTEDLFGSVGTVVKAIKGEVSKAEGIHAALGLIDYAVVTLMPHEEAVPVKLKGKAATNAPKTEKQICKELEGVLSSSSNEVDGVPAVGESEFPWGVVVPMLIDLLRKWLKF